MTPCELYNEANAAYERGDYAQAIELYEQAVRTTQNSCLYYNLGNAYFKSGQIGKALLNYQRARFLKPRDRDINANIQFLRNYRIDKMLTIENPIIKIIANFFHFLSFQETLFLSALSFFVMMVLIALAIIFYQRVLAYIAIVGAVIFLYSFISWQIWQGERSPTRAVIIVPEVTLHSGPGQEYKDIYIAHDGLEVKVLESRGDYSLVQFPGGGGWLETKAIESIF
ncbi:MAG: tetratricopeptide repeat protein [candidate division WOR-3 bacterium]